MKKTPLLTACTTQVMSLEIKKFLGDGRWGGQRGLAFAMYVFSRVKCQTSAEHSRWLATLRKKKQRGQSTVEAKKARREEERVQK